MKKLQQKNKIILLPIIQYETITFCGENEELPPESYDDIGSSKNQLKKMADFTPYFYFGNTN